MAEKAPFDPGNPELLSIYHLFGDPAMRIHAAR